MEYKQLNEIADVKGGKRLPKGYQLTNLKTDHMYLRICDYNNGVVDLENIKYINNKIFEEIRNYIINKGDIFLSIVGTIGIVSYIEKELDGANLTENAVKIMVKDDCSYDPIFLSYYLKSPQGQFEIESRTVGSTQKKLAIKRIKKINVPNLNIFIQKQISKILYTLDKKIEINNKIISNLENRAQAIFKSWFVDFEPFQDEEFVESELGLIPKGWEVRNLGEITKIKSGKRPKVKSKIGSFPIIGANGKTGMTDNYLYDQRLILIGRVGTLGQVNRIDKKIWASDNTLVFKSDDYEYVYYILQNIDYSSLNRGSTQPLITQGDLKKIKIIYPEITVLKKFSILVGNIFEYIWHIESENNKLSQIRDTLLPKLMSGEIDVSNINIDKEDKYE